MDLSLSEAARLLGKSDRQVRYLIREGKLKARKDSGRWIVRREDLPLSGGQERAAKQKRQRAAQMAEEILRPEGADAKNKYSIRNLRAYREGSEIYRQLTADAGADHAATTGMRESLMLLACGYHEFQAETKADFYARARQEASRVTMALLLEDEEAHREKVERLENGFLPALGGLVNQAEKRGRGRRGRRSAGAR